MELQHGNSPSERPRATRLREIRVGKGLSILALTLRTGIPSPTLYRYETGKIRQPCLANALAIADALGVDVAELFPPDEEEVA